MSANQSKYHSQSSGIFASESPECDPLTSYSDADKTPGNVTAPREQAFAAKKRAIKELIAKKEAANERAAVRKPTEMATPRAPKVRYRGSALSASQTKTVQEAQEQESIIFEKLRRSDCKLPPYRLQNYIGKGTYGRVYLAYVSH